MTRPPLTRNDWLEQGFRLLVEGGAGALSVAAMARRLGASKGSFYWHFSDVGAFKTALLGLWEPSASDALFDVIETCDDPHAALAQYLELCAMDESGPGLEVAMREWARHDKEVAQVLARVDRRRVGMLAELMARQGEDTARLPMVLHAVQLGLDQLHHSLGPVPASARRALVHMVQKRA